MMKFKVFGILLGLISMAFLLQAQGNVTDAQEIIKRLNNETSNEEGCTQREFHFDQCEFSVSLNCGGNDILLFFNLEDIQRVYLDKADFEDPFETLFFECIAGNNCIKNNMEGVPPSPVFPIKLPENSSSTLGIDAVKVFSKLIETCP